MKLELVTTHSELCELILMVLMPVSLRHPCTASALTLARVITDVHLDVVFFFISQLCLPGHGMKVLSVIAEMTILGRGAFVCWYEFQDDGVVLSQHWCMCQTHISSINSVKTSLLFSESFVFSEFFLRKPLGSVAWLLGGSWRNLWVSSKADGPGVYSTEGRTIWPWGRRTPT